MGTEKRELQNQLRDLIANLKYFREDVENGEYPDEFANREYSKRRLEEAYHSLLRALEHIDAIN